MGASFVVVGWKAVVERMIVVESSSGKRRCDEVRDGMMKVSQVRWIMLVLYQTIRDNLCGLIMKTFVIN